MSDTLPNHPRLPGRLLAGSAWGDEPAHWPVTNREVAIDSAYAQVRTDVIESPQGEHMHRLVVQPHGAVAVLAVDEAGRVLLVSQYRHPVGLRMLELPAGTLDISGEPRLVTAQRELAEEADVTAGKWREILALTMTPGYSSEQVWAFVAQDLAPVTESDRHERQHEEAEIEQYWVTLPDALQAITDGRLTDAISVAALLQFAHNA